MHRLAQGRRKVHILIKAGKFGAERFAHLELLAANHLYALDHFAGVLD